MAARTARCLRACNPSCLEEPPPRLQFCTASAWLAPQAHASLVARAPASGASGPPQHTAAPAQDAAAVEDSISIPDVPSAGGALPPRTASRDSGSSHSSPLPQHSRGGGSSQHDDPQRPFLPDTAQPAAQPEDAPGGLMPRRRWWSTGSQPAAKYRTAWRVPGHAAGRCSAAPQLGCRVTGATAGAAAADGAAASHV